jgi:hypothetical protein
MEFITAEEVKNFLEDNIKTSYRERYKNIVIHRTEGNITNIKVLTSYRAEFLDSLLELLITNKVNYNSYHKAGHTVDVTDILLPNNRKARILIKPPSNQEWRQKNYWNEKLELLPNWNRLKRSPDSRGEYEALKEMNAKIHEYSGAGSVTILMKSYRYDDIIGFIPGPFGSKADFVGLNSSGKGVLFISHKDGRGPKAFQQYSGISERAGDEIYDDDEVQEWRNVISSKDKSDFNNGKAYYRNIKDIELKKKAVFGNKYSAGQTDPNNIDFFCQGKAKLTKRSNGEVNLKFDSKMVHRTQISQLNRSGYAPTFGARRGEAYRRVEYGEQKVEGVRAGIFSAEYIKGRKTTKEI